MPDDRSRWERRYGASTNPGGHRTLEAPSRFLVSHAELLGGRVLDVAAGAGRNAVFLARRGCSVDAIDIALNGLRAIQAKARAAGLDIRLLQTDLESFPLPETAYDGIINIRYLQRSLFAPLQRALKPGGILLFETFLIEQQAIGHPRNPNFLLQHGELRAAFANFNILVYEEGLLPTESQPAY